MFLLLGLALTGLWYYWAHKNRASYGRPIWQFLVEILFSLITGDPLDSLALVGVGCTLIGILVVLNQYL